MTEQKDNYEIILAHHVKEWDWEQPMTTILTTIYNIA
jgi:hypothetical protein